VRIPSKAIPIAVEADIAAKPDRFAILELGEDQFLDPLHREVEVVDALAFHHVAEIIDRVVLDERLIGGRRIDDRLILVDFIADILVKEDNGVISFST
jgi:hypothetical protein